MLGAQPEQGRGGQAALAGPLPLIIADARASAGPAMPVRYVDIGVTHPVHLARGRCYGDACGVAAAVMEHDKEVTYMPDPEGMDVEVAPLIIESFGRWGSRAERELLRLATQRVARCAARTALVPAQAFGAIIRRWRERVSIALTQGNF